MFPERYNLRGDMPVGATHPAPDPRVVELVAEIKEKLPYAEDWLATPHALLGGESPNQVLEAGDIDRVRNLLGLILYLGIT